jgi:hypothetical protein
VHSGSPRPGLDRCCGAVSAGLHAAVRSGGVPPPAITGSQLTWRVMTTWIQRSSAAAQAVRACWRASRLSSQVVRWVNLAAMTGLFGSVAHCPPGGYSQGRRDQHCQVMPQIADYARSVTARCGGAVEHRVSVVLPLQGQLAACAA